MSITSIKPYFSSKLVTLGFEEWPDGFGDDNIPSTLVDRTFHQRFINASGTKVNQESFEMLVTHQIKVFFKGFRDPAAAIDQGLLESQSLIAELLNLADYSTAGIKGLFFANFTVEPFDDVQNDNLIVATLTFDVLVFNCIG